MALREVTVEVTAKYIIKFQVNSADEVEKKVANVILSDVVPDDINYSVIDVKPMEVSYEDMQHKRSSAQESANDNHCKRQ
jgi:hypothetical protein